MKTYSNYYVGCLLMGALASAAPAQNTAQPMKEEIMSVSTKQDGVILSVALPKKNIAGASLSLTCVIENQGKAPVYYFRSGGRELFEINIVDSRGKEVPATRFGRLNMPYDERIHQTTQVIQPGKKKVIEVSLARHFDLTLADTYTMTIGRNFNDAVKAGAIRLVIKKIEFKVEEPKH